jgi:hypothetical protein
LLNLAGQEQNPTELPRSIASNHVRNSFCAG